MFGIAEYTDLILLVAIFRDSPVHRENRNIVTSSGETVFSMANVSASCSSLSRVVSIYV